MIRSARQYTRDIFIFNMPELPEVETIRLQLESLIGEQIGNVTVHRYDIARGDIETIVGKSIIGVRRFGKLIVIDFSSEVSVAIHLKMTGRLSVLMREAIAPKHTHVELLLRSNRRLTFSDARRFGYIQVIATDEVDNLPFIQNLGKEPLKDFTLPYFQTILKKSSRPIKTLLLDQTRIAGLGNIYASEALWIARVNPITPAKQLLAKEIRALFKAINSVLREGIQRGGASDNTYRDLRGEKGSYQHFFKVYNRKGKPCSRCGAPIAMIRQAGRSTFFCPKCQALGMRE